MSYTNTYNPSQPSTQQQGTAYTSGYNTAQPLAEPQYAYNTAQPSVQPYANGYNAAPPTVQQRIQNALPLPFNTSNSSQPQRALQLPYLSNVVPALESKARSLADNVKTTLGELSRLTERPSIIPSNVSTILSSGADVSTQLAQHTLPKVTAAAVSIDNAGRSLVLTSKLIQLCALAGFVLLLLLIYKTVRSKSAKKHDPNNCVMK